MQQNSWELGNLTRVNLREHLNLFLGNKEETLTFPREHGNIQPPGRRSQLLLEIDVNSLRGSVRKSSVKQQVVRW